MAYQEIREECLEANRDLPKTGLVDLTFGSVSVLDMAAGVFAIKPSGFDYDALRAEDMVILDLDGNVVEGSLRPSSDTPTHSRLLRAFADRGIRSVVHTHSRTAVAFAQAGREVPCLGTTHADYFFGSVPVTRMMTPVEISDAYEANTAEVILERFREIDPAQVPAVLVHGHGPFAWGKSGAKAVETAMALEIVSEMAWKALLLSPHIPLLNTAQHEKHFLRKHGPGAYYGQPGG